MNIFYVDRDRLVPTKLWGECTACTQGYPHTHAHDYEGRERVIEEKMELIQEGHIDPIEVAEVTDGAPIPQKGGKKLYYVQNGHHRMEAYNRLGIDKVPVFISVGG